MSFFVWEDDLSVGVEEIDRQHGRLIDLINDVYETMQSGRGREALDKIIADLADYTDYHFATEEKAMLRLHYPDYASHKAEHDAFVARVVDFRERHQGGEVLVSLDVLNFLKEWLGWHIRRVDKSLAPFLEGLPPD